MGRHSRGAYCVTRHAQNPQALLDWIRQTHYLDCETATQQVKRHGRIKNRLFDVNLASEHQTLMMKVCSVNPNYIWRRRIELYIKQWFKDYSLVSF